MIYVDERPRFLFSERLKYSVSRVAAHPQSNLAETTGPTPLPVRPEELIVPAEKFLTKFLGNAVLLSQSGTAPTAQSALVVNTNFGCAEEAKEFLRVIYDKGFHYASPLRFPSTVNSSLLGTAARLLRIEGDAVLLIGENAACLGVDLLASSPTLESCMCISIDSIASGNVTAQYCSVLRLTKRRDTSWRSVASVMSVPDPANLCQHLAAALDGFGAPAVLLYASGGDRDMLPAEFSALSHRLWCVYACRISEAEAGGSFVAYFLADLADRLAPDHPIVVVNDNHLSAIELICLGASG